MFGEFLLIHRDGSYPLAVERVAFSKRPDMRVPAEVDGFSLSPLTPPVKRLTESTVSFDDFHYSYFCENIMMKKG